ncbi:MAG: hypothetical protein IKC95_01760 [Oscillospiraceae bacterium]|nr:hypothetical protein [Oscillospiraceae bacterium]
MNAVIYSPLEEYENKYKDLHMRNAEKFFEELVAKSKVNIEENRATVKEYDAFIDNLSKLKRKLNLYRFLRVIMIITIILIPIVIWKMTPKIRAMRSDIDAADARANALLALAHKQMQPLNQLFTANDAISIMEETIPLLEFDPCFSVKQEMDMITNFDFQTYNGTEQSTLDTLSGRYNENPFLFENKLIHTMGSETYHGYKTIHWTETYRDSNGRLRRRTRSQTLHATVTKPKPLYNTQVVLNYGSQGGPELSFSRDATHLEQKSESAIERYIKKGEKKLKKLTDEAIKENDDFMSMSNTDFEVLFDALDRTNEVQFRTLFTPLAQNNMVELILSKVGYGDDFYFLKHNRMNKIISKHSQGRSLLLLPNSIASHSFDIIKENFSAKHAEYFRAVYFDFAPLLAIPMYQERPVHSLKPIPDFTQLYSQKESEVLANAVDYQRIVHPNTKTQAILKSKYIRSNNKEDEICVTAYSYNIIQRVDIIPVLGGDGRIHNVSVPWDDYIPLENSKHFYIAESNSVQNKKIIARRNGLCIYQ